MTLIFVRHGQAVSNATGVVGTVTHDANPPPANTQAIADNTLARLKNTHIMNK